MILGTPNDTTWPNVTELPNFKPNFPKWIGKTIKQVCPRLDAAGCDLLMVSYCSMILFNSSVFNISKC